jgi:hypothetical protein
VGSLSWLARNRATVISVCLALLILTPFIYWIIAQNQETNTPEPSGLYFFKGLGSVDNETMMKVWNSTKNLKKLHELSTHGNYSVLIYPHVYATGGPFYAEWFVAASTLQPDNKGLIHELPLRFDYYNFTLVESYEQAYNFNPTSIENGEQTVKDFIAQDPNHYFVTVQNYQTNYPFLVCSSPPLDFGISIILNLNTGKLMVAATSVWMGHGGLLYPERIPRMGESS